MRLWLSQGPPGTGKTTASVAFFSLIRSISTGPTIKSPPVLMLAVKNHALDQFLDRVRAVDSKMLIVRVGGRASTEALAETNLYNLRQKAIDKCMKERVTGKLLECWKKRGETKEALRNAQASLGDILNCSMIGGVLPAHIFLTTLTPFQLYSLIKGAENYFESNNLLFDESVIDQYASLLESIGDVSSDEADNSLLDRSRKFLRRLSGARPP